MTTADLTTDSLSAHVDTDLPCFACGYDLRTLAWEGLCPECGRPVRDSAPPTNLRFASYRSIRRTRLGIAVWVVAIALPTACSILFIVGILIGPALWLRPASEHGLLRKVYRTTAYMSSNGPLAGYLLQAAAIMLITRPFAQRSERFRPRLAFTTTGLALFSVCATVLLFVPLLSVIPLLNSRSAVVVAWVGAAVAWALSQVLAWTYLTARLDRRASRGVCLAMRVALVAPIMLTLGVLAQAIILFASPWTWTAPAPGIIPFALQSWVVRGQQVADIWAKYGRSLCQIAMLIVLWVYLRKLNAALHIPR